VTDTYVWQLFVGELYSHDDPPVRYVQAQFLVFYCECGRLSILFTAISWMLLVKIDGFHTDTSCCTVKIHIQSADLVLFKYTAGKFSVLLWMWQSVCSSYCRQLNAVSFNTGTSCCTVQIHIQSADLVHFRYIAESFRCIVKFRTVTISFVISDGPPICLHGTTVLPLHGLSWNYIYE